MYVITSTTQNVSYSRVNLTMLYMVKAMYYTYLFLINIIFISCNKNVSHITEAVCP